jgi:hypothetical protein
MRIVFNTRRKPAPTRRSVRASARRVSTLAFLQIAFG